ncbi:helix-turn-helix domain-containing protein [Aquimarina litoralis]|uniref:helix-turn-helix domain-containing protein n=1 Tax=Aquimarina litoralis TaxID=584605 RepID=UPI001C590811|nr:helix-turn-helix domain-containing protein [Aquimarina litoralis]MBW1298581.1 helix-turn-helix domain-containing protein [Aquimarina litoralis]
MHISLYEFFILLIIGQCIFLIFAIQYIPKKNSGTNRMIQYLLAIYSFYLLERVIHSEIPGDFLRRYAPLTNVFYLFIGPFVYTYIRRLLFFENGKYHLAFYHYLPAVLYLLYVFFHIYMYDSIVDLCNYQTIFFFTVEILFFISITTYLFKSYLLFNYYKKNKTKELSFNPNSTKYIQVTLICLMLYMSFWLLGIFELFDIITWIKRSLIYDISCLIFGVQIYIVSFYNLKYPEIFKIPFPSNIKSEQKKKNKLDEQEANKIKNLVDAFFKEKKGYRQAELSLSILANEINTTTNKLSWVLNNIYKKNFYELVNEYRVDEFIQSIKEDKHKEYTVVSIGFDVGFKSKSTFYKAFKTITNFTPTEYIKKIESEKRAETSDA